MADLTTADVNLGDLAIALQAIAPTDPGELDVLAACFGFSLVPELAPDPAATQGTTAATTEIGGATRDTGRQADTGDAGRTEDDLPLLAVVMVQPPEAPRPWELAEDELLHRFDEKVHLAGIAQHAPLLDPRWSRQVLGHTLATPRTDGELDTEAAVETIASGRALDPLPLLVRHSLARGAQVLVDVGAGMTPFARDAWELVAEVERVVGRSQVQMLMFDTVLSAGCGSGPIWTWSDYEPPNPGVPVLVLTDAGLSAAEGTLPAYERVPDWLGLATRLAGNGSPLALFVPYPPARWDADLSDAVVLVEWDRSTTVGTVHSLRDALHAAVVKAR